MKTIRPRLNQAEYEVLTKLRSNSDESASKGYNLILKESHQLGRRCAELEKLRKKELADNEDLKAENNKLHMRNMDLNDYNNKLIDEMEMNAQEASYSADANIKLKETIKAQVSEINHLKTKCTTLESKLHHAVTEGAKACNKLNDVIQSKDAAISAGHNLLMEESADNSYLVGKINSIHRWYCWSIFTITSAAIASHFIWG